LLSRVRIRTMSCESARANATRPKPMTITPPVVIVRLACSCCVKAPIHRKSVAPLIGSGWPDVVVDPEQVARVIFILQPGQPVVVGAIGGARSGVGLLLKIIDIGTWNHERVHGVPALARPFDVSLSLRHFGPAR
jgi:hypothetical protein